jgi:hypothetical protein
MADYIITSPDGKEYVVSAPEGAKESDILDFTKSQWQAPQQVPQQTPQQPVMARSDEPFIRQADEDSFMQNLLAGAGGAFKGMDIGARQILPGVKAPSAEEVKEWKDSMSGLRGTLGGNIGEIGTSILTAAPAAMVGGVSVPVAAGTAALQGALTPAESLEERGMNVGASAALAGTGQKIANVLSDRVGKGIIRNQLTPEAQKHIAAGEDIGMRFTPGQRTGSPTMVSFERTMAGTPIMSASFNKIEGANQNLANQIVADAIGQKGESEVGSRVLGEAQKRLGDVFESARDKTPIFIDKKTINKFNRIGSDFENLISPNADVRLLRQVQEMLNDPSQQVTAAELGRLSTQLRQKAQSEIGSAQGDRNLARAMFEVREMLESKIANSLAPSEKRAYNKARDEYGNLMTMIARGVTNESSGNVDIRKLAAALNKTDRADFTLGGADTPLTRLAHAARAEPAVTGGDMGAKLSALNLMRQGITPLGVGAGAVFGGLPGALGVLATEAAVPKMYLRAGDWASRAQPSAANKLRALSRHTTPQFGGLSARGMSDGE